MRSFAECKQPSSTARWIQNKLASGVHNPASGVERDVDNDAKGGGGVTGGQLHPMKCYILGLLR